MKEFADCHFASIDAIFLKFDDLKFLNGVTTISSDTTSFHLESRHTQVDSRDVINVLKLDKNLCYVLPTINKDVR